MGKKKLLLKEWICSIHTCNPGDLFCSMFAAFLRDLGGMERKV